MASKVIKDFTEALLHNREPSEEAMLAVGGWYWYRCIANQGYYFPNGDSSRTGLVAFILKKSADGGVIVVVYGRRLAATAEPPKDVNEAQTPLPNAENWIGRGFVTSDGRRVTFRWESDSEQGHIEETILIPRDLAAIWPGDFKLTKGNEAEITGRVWYDKIEGEQQTKWLPNDFHPPFDDIVPDEEVASWGQRLYDSLPPEEHATDSDPYVLIDIVMGKHRRANPHTIFDVSASMENDFPGSVLHCAERAQPDTGFLGSVR